MILLLTCLAAAWALDPDPAIQAVHEAEWRRDPPAAFEAWARDPEAEVRGAAAVALGRLRSRDALPLLQALLADADPAVRLRALEALGWTPGAATILRDRLKSAPRPAGFAGAQAEEESGELTRTLLGLGRIGDVEDVDRIRPWLAEPWPVGAAAAEALGRMARRNLDGTQAAVPELLRCAGRLDARTAEACAFAVSRIGVKQAELAAPAVAGLDRIASEQARAWLVKGLWPGLDAAARTQLFVDSVRSGGRLEQVAALDAVEKGDLPTDLVAPYLFSADGWVRSAAISALGRLGTDEARAALDRYAKEADRWAAAAAIEAAGASEAGAIEDRALPAQIRAALVASVKDPAALLRIAKEDPEPVVRSAAAGALVEDDRATWQMGLELLASPDPALREAAFELLDHREDAIGAAIVAAAPAETDPEVLRAGLDRLTELAKADPKKWTAERTAPALARASAFSSARVAEAARHLAAATGARAPDRAPAADHRDLALADGSIVGVGPELPPPAALARIETAVVRTDRGEFVIDLDPETAPLAVWNFAQLADAGYYDGRPVHRLVPGFVMQTGCPRGDGWGGPGWTLPDEPSLVPYDEGSVGMARSDLDTGGSQWFVTLADTPHLTGEYTRFGQVVHGMSVVRHLARGDRIVSVRIERAGGPAPAAPPGPAAP